MKKSNYLLTIGLVAMLSACGSTTTTTTIKDDQTPKEEVQQTQKAEENITIQITQDDHKTVLSEKEVTVTEGQTLMDVMNEQFELTTEYDGTFITGIDGVIADEKQQFSWMFYVNDELAMKGASDITVNPGDKIEFSLEKWK